MAQIYENKTSNGKEKKAKIKQHSDKTKDMPRNALMAFCTFYDNLLPKDREEEGRGRDEFDYCIKNNSVLTRLRFKLKDCIANCDTIAHEIMWPMMKKQFDVILYPNSVFVMSLSTNRLYTHEIVPSVLPIDVLPTRMGYVIRCSNTRVIFKDNATFIENNILREPTIKEIDELRNLYYKENTTDELIEYNDIFYSMNSGDYKKPLL